MSYPFELPDLGYNHDALEPHIDARTMEIHHGKHHAAYTSNPVSYTHLTLPTNREV